jgi:ATP-binding cassette, subfamily B, bacterial MsbA
MAADFMRHFAQVFKFGWPYVRPYLGRFMAGVLLGVLFGLSNQAFMWVAKTMIERLDPATVEQLAAPAAARPAQPGTVTGWLEQTKTELTARADKLVDPWFPKMGRPMDARQVVGAVLLLPLLAAFRGYVGFLSSYCMGWVGERMVTDMRTDVLIKLNSLSLDFFNRSKMGDLLSRVQTDTGALHRALSLGMSDLIKEPVTILAILPGLFIVDWRLSLFVCLFFPLTMLPVLILGRKVRFVMKANVKAAVTQTSLLIEAIAAIRVVKAFGLEAAQVERFKALSRDLVRTGTKNVQARELVNPTVETISMLGAGGLIVFVFYVGTGLADLVAFLLGIALCYAPIKKLAGLHILFQQTSAGVERLLSLFAEQPTVREAENPVRLDGFHDRLALRGMHFNYGGRPVLQDLTFDLPRGHKLGVAGESGSGKSTLVNLLFRFYDPTAGAILIDGHDLRAVAQRDLQRLMALVSQEIVLFDLTVAENIACGRPGASRAEIEAAARAANAHDFIQQLPQGYDTRIGERGVTLSGGQRQRLAVARAFIRDAPILLLDEATASLDSASEAEVQAAIERLEKDRTVVCVAHRLSTLANMDSILVLAEGRVVQRGTFQELLKVPGPFAEMARRQGLQA